MNKYENFKVCKFYQILHFILKIYHNFESYQYMLTTLGFCFLYHKLTTLFCMSWTLHPIYMWWRTLENLKFLKYFEFQKFKIPYLLNCECFLNLGNRLLSSLFFYHQNYDIAIVLYLILCKINHKLMQHLCKFEHHFLKPNPKI